MLLNDVVRVVRAAVPFGFLAPLAGDVFSELKIARRADAILGRAAALTAQETGTGCTGLSGLDVFDDNPMPPVVAKIIRDNRAPLRRSSEVQIVWSTLHC